jgi:hypothetical protein
MPADEITKNEMSHTGLGFAPNFKHKKSKFIKQIFLPDELEKYYLEKEADMLEYMKHTVWTSKFRAIDIYQ